MTNSGYRAHSALIFPRLGCIRCFSIQVNSFHVAELMFCCHNQLLPQTFHDLFITSSQVHSYNTKTATSYRPYCCRTNLKQFFIWVLKLRIPFRHISKVHRAFLPLRNECTSFYSNDSDLFMPHIRAALFLYLSLLLLLLRGDLLT